MDMTNEESPTRFDKVFSMISKYIMEGSCFEINIEAKMRNKVMKV